MKKTSPKNRDRRIAEIQREIESFLERNPFSTFKKRQLAKVLGYTSDHEYARFKQALRQLEKDGEVRQTARRKFGSARAADASQEHVGIDNSSGGHSIQSIPKDVHEKPGMRRPKSLHEEKPGGSTRKGKTTDYKSHGWKPENKNPQKPETAKSVEDVEKSERNVIGRIERIGSSFKLLLHDRDLPAALDVSRKKLNGAREGDKVLARITLDRYRDYLPEVLNVFGEAGDPEVELKTIASEFALRTDFPERVTAETHSIPERIPDEELALRLDFRSEFVFTIDPQDARDFDDAVSLKRLHGDLFELGVHIADVSHYVTEGSNLDVEAYKRGTSVYLTNGVIPMLPEKLSNDICSLNPDVDRLTYSVVINIRATGKVESHRLAKSVIRSKRRFTYEEVQQIIESGKGDFSHEILEMDQLAKTLNRLRTRAGSIDFDLPEAKFVFDELGRPVEIVKKSRLDSHRLVEEFMLLANKIVAAHIGSHGTRSKPFIYRVHDAPDPERINELAVFVSHFGYDLRSGRASSGSDHSGGVGQKELQKLLKSVEGKPEEYIINDILLRSMAKAIYSEKNIGHYGLAFKYYTHFTSPIRRYPDLVVHRLLYRYDGGAPLSDLSAVKKMVADVSKVSSDAERRAVEAERESVKIKQAQYMMEHIGDEFNGTVSGVTNFGLFVEIDDLLVEGLVHVREISRSSSLKSNVRDGARRSDDYYVFVPDRLQLRGRRTGKTYQFGDRICVKVLRVNMDRREIDFALCS